MVKDLISSNFLNANEKKQGWSNSIRNIHVMKFSRCIWFLSWWMISLQFSMWIVTSLDGFNLILNTQLRGGPLEITGGGVKIFQWMNFLFSGNCCINFFQTWRLCTIFFSTALLLSYFGSVYLQEFFFCNCHPPPPVISNGPPLNTRSDPMIDQNSD